MNFQQESIHASLVLKASCISLPVTKLRQDLYRLHNTVTCKFEQKPKLTIKVAGSLAECYFGYTFKRSDVMLSSDVDVIAIDNTRRVHQHIGDLIINNILNPTLEHLLHIQDEPGYARLAFSPENEMAENEMAENEMADCHTESRFYLRNDQKEKLYQIDRKSYPVHNICIHGPAVTSINLFADVLEHFHAGGTLPLNYTNLKKDANGNVPDNFKDIDCVSCLEGKTWPVEAAKWATRKRLSNWPTEELIQKILKSGYILAGVGSKESKKSEFQWRISFNNAELFLFESFNETEIHCIWLLKSLKAQLSDKAGKNITSYTMKTVMFWCMEEKSNEYWQSSNLVNCFCACISKLKSFVEKQFLPNYFIMERNMFILSEFTSSMQTKTIRYLDRLLDNPTETIISFLPKCDINNEIPISERQITEVFIMEWILTRVTMTTCYYSVCKFWKLYDRYNIENSFQQCKAASEKLSTINYTQPFVKTLTNCMAILQYILLKKEREIVEQTSDLDKRNKCLENMKISFKANKTNTRLRIATCYLDNGVKGKYQILKFIRKVTDKEYVNHDYSLENNLYFLKKLWTVLKDFENMPKERKNNEIEIYNSVIDYDLTIQDPYKTYKKFKQFKKDGRKVRGYGLFKLIWNECWFDVTFMPAEVSILPKPAALELCIVSNSHRISFNPFLYGLLLEFLWHVKNDSNIKDRTKIIEKMVNCVQIIPEGQQTIGLNFITYCYALQQDYYSASQYLIRSFILNPTKTNVAYLYIKYIINLLMITMRCGPC